jgi:hypothetical protein
MFNSSIKTISIACVFIVLCGCSLFQSGSSPASSSAGPGSAPPTTSPQPIVTPTANASSSPQPTASQPAAATPTLAPTQTPPAETPGQKQTALQFAGQVAAALQARDMNKLADLADPKAGVMFSPYSYIDVQHDVVLLPDRLRKMSFESKDTYVWGTFDGSGMEMKLTFAEYYKRFVYDRDFLKVGQTAVNKTIKTGNTAVNLSEAYPKATFVEYHVPGADPKAEGMDWSSLRLIIKQDSGGTWRLVGISHDQWTI